MSTADDIRLDSIEDAIAAIAAGEFVVVVEQAQMGEVRIARLLHQAQVDGVDHQQPGEQEEDHDG